MTRGSISDNYLKSLTAEKIDKTIIEKFGITKSDLDYLRTGDIVKSIYDAAELLKKKNEEIKLLYLSALIFDHYKWKDLDSCYKNLSYKISKIYKERRKEKERITGLKIPDIQLLREDIGAYYGNLYEAHKVYDFEAGTNDWLRNVKIPINLGGREMKLLGVYWTDGCIEKGNKTYSLILSGRHDDKEFYKILEKEIEEIHNITKTLIYEKRAGFSEKSKSPIYPVIRIDSKAIGTWLMGLGFPFPKKNVELPKIEWNKEKRRGFAIGVIASRGNINYNQLLLITRDKIFIENLRILFEEENFTPYLSDFRDEDGRTYYKINFSQNELKRMIDEDMFWNPRHIKKLKIFYKIHRAL